MRQVCKDETEKLVMKKLLMILTCTVALTFGGSALATAKIVSAASTTKTHQHTDTNQAEISTSAHLNVAGALVIGAAAVVVGGYELKRQSGQQGMSHDILEIDPSLSEEFEPLYYGVQDAWSANNQERLSELMAPAFFEKRKQLLDQWQAAGKVNRYEGMVIVRLDQERNVKTAPRVVVTAQGRNYFEYPGRSAKYNREQYEQTMFRRYKEVWELNRDASGQLRVAQIRN